MLCFPVDLGDIMLYFIPAWYQQNKWRESKQSWHTRRMHTEFDDTVKQVQMFYRNGMRDFKILLLSHTPNFRHFLHRQGVFHAPYWSCFDAIQEVERRKAAVFSFHNLSWPDNIELSIHLLWWLHILKMLNTQRLILVKLATLSKLVCIMLAH